MRKIIFAFIASIFSFQMVSAFSLDVDEINIDSLNEELFSTIPASYKIDTNTFSASENISDDIKDLVDKLISLSTSSNIEQSLTPYMYIDNQDGAQTLAATLFLKMYADKIKDLDITYSSIQRMKMASVNDDKIVFVYLKNSIVSKEKQDVVFAFWLKKNIDAYKLYMPWFTLGSSLENYFDTLSQQERLDQHITNSFKELSFTNSETDVNEYVLQQLYNKLNDSVVQITGVTQGSENTYGSGFFINKGIVATSWSLISSYLRNSDTIYINDLQGNTYFVDGIITVNTPYDLVLLKIDKEVGKPVVLGDSLNLRTDDKLFLIHSMENINSSIKYGSFISEQNGRLKNLLALHSSEIGSALFNIKGEVVAFATNDIISSELSIANSTNYLKNIQKILSQTQYKDIRVIPLQNIKNNYYIEKNNETSENKIPAKIWEQFKQVGSLENSINIPLVKANYVDGIISLRYKNTLSSVIDTMYLANDYEKNLLESNYENIYSSYNQKIYQKNKHQIIIKIFFDYLVIISKEA